MKPSKDETLTPIPLHDLDQPATHGANASIGFRSLGTYLLRILYKILIIVCAVWLITKDWLVADQYYYPYAASAATSLAVIFGFLVSWFRPNPLLWRNIILVLSTYLSLADLLGVAQGTELNLLPVAILTCGFAVPASLSSLIASPHRFTQSKLCFGLALVIGIAAIELSPNISGTFPFWHVFILGVVASTGGLVWLNFLAAPTNNSHPAHLGYLLKFAPTLVYLVGLVSLCLWALWPFMIIPPTEKVLLGLGLGNTALYGTSSGTAVDVIVREQGIITLFAVGFILIVNLSQVAKLLTIVNDQYESQYPVPRFDLCSGAVSSLSGILTCAFVEPAFLTANSVAGTWVLCISIASLFIATSHPYVKAQRRTSTHRCKGLTYLGFLSLSICPVGSCIYYINHLKEVIEPFVGSKAPNGYADYSALISVSQPMQDATVAMEDQYFYQHHGFDWKSMHHALRANIRQGHIDRGGSTITQELAKNLFLTKSRTFVRKLKEAAYTIELEHLLPKRRILEIYLNTIDYGMGQRGITSAAAYYFHKSPKQLTLAESTFLVGLVPDPPQKALHPYRLLKGQRTALARIENTFPERYSDDMVEQAQAIPLDRLVYPYKDAWDRGATDTVPATWHGISFYPFYSPLKPLAINYVAPCLKQHLASFLDMVHSQYGVSGIDHLGVYADRSIRGASTGLSAHAFGQAIDIAGFRFRNGSRIRVMDYKDPQVLVRLKPLEVLLKRNFDLVIDWRTDPKRHQTHFHCEVKGQRDVAQRESLPN